VNTIEEANALSLAETEVARLTEIMHRQGLTYWQILDIFLRASVKAHCQASAEYRMKEKGRI